MSRAEITAKAISNQQEQAARHRPVRELRFGGAPAFPAPQLEAPAPLRSARACITPSIETRAMTFLMLLSRHLPRSFRTAHHDAGCTYAGQAASLAKAWNVNLIRRRPRPRASSIPLLVHFLRGCRRSKVRKTWLSVS